MSKNQHLMNAREAESIASDKMTKMVKHALKVINDDIHEIASQAGDSASFAFDSLCDVTNFKTTHTNQKALMNIVKRNLEEHGYACRLESSNDADYALNISWKLYEIYGYY